MRYLLLSQLDYDAPGGVRAVKKPYPVDAVEEFVNYLRENKQWRNRPEILHQRVGMLMTKLDRVGPLATVEVPATLTTAAPCADVAPPTFACECGFEAKSKAGLGAHRRKHVASGV